jgi:alkylhydroperoxidase family enzyme
MDEMMAHEFADRSLMPGQEPDREGSRTQSRTAGHCAPWATRSRRYDVSSAPAGRRSAYPNSASATAGEDIATACHIRFASGVSMFRTTDKGGDMTSTTRIPPAEITGIKGALMKRMTTKMMGQVPTPLGVYWHNPKVLKASFAIGKKVQKWDQCEENLKSIAHMAVASLVGCTWCLDFNYFQAHNENLDLEKAREVPRWRESDVFTPLERDVMEYAEAMSQTPPTVTDELSARLLEQLGAAALVELTAVISFANFTTRGNVALGIESDGFAQACDLKPLAVPRARPGVASAS